MYNFMGNKGQYYQDGVKEVEEFNMLHMDLRMTVGPVCVIAFNDDPLSFIQSQYMKVGFEMEGQVTTELLILN